MAIDTAAKRASVLGISTVLLPIPNGTIVQADRQSLVRYYGGILVGAAIESINTIYGNITGSLCIPIATPIVKRMSK